MIISLLVSLFLSVGCVSPNYTPSLETWEGPSYREIQGRPDDLFALEQMFDKLEWIGSRPVLISGYRSYEYQARLHEQDPYWTEPAGCSQHQLGTAFDIGWWGYGLRSPHDIRLWRELRILAPEYGFEIPYDGTGDIPLEPWHLNYIGERYEMDRRDSTNRHSQ